LQEKVLIKKFLRRFFDDFMLIVGVWLKINQCVLLISLVIQSSAIKHHQSYNGNAGDFLSLNS